MAQPAAKSFLHVDPDRLVLLPVPLLAGDRAHLGWQLGALLCLLWVPLEFGLVLGAPLHLLQGRARPLDWGLTAAYLLWALGWGVAMLRPSRQEELVVRDGALHYGTQAMSLSHVVVPRLRAQWGRARAVEIADYADQEPRVFRVGRALPLADKERAVAWVDQQFRMRRGTSR